MISNKELRRIARGRLRDAQVLLLSKRFDGAFYLCGYAVELALKARICRTLRWSRFPSSAKEFEGLKSVRTHDLSVLLRFSGIEARIKERYMAEWSVVVRWNPERRYQANRSPAGQEAADMIKCVERLLGVL
jgi:HEPN domain-containing protein